MIRYTIKFALKEQYYENSNKRLERFDGYAWHQQSDISEYFIDEYHYNISEFRGRACIRNLNSNGDII